MKERQRRVRHVLPANEIGDARDVSARAREAALRAAYGLRHPGRARGKDQQKQRVLGDTLFDIGCARCRVQVPLIRRSVDED